MSMSSVTGLTQVTGTKAAIAKLSTKQSCGERKLIYSTRLSFLLRVYVRRVASPTKKHFEAYILLLTDAAVV